METSPSLARKQDMRKKEMSFTQDSTDIYYNKESVKLTAGTNKKNNGGTNKRIRKKICNKNRDDEKKINEIDSGEKDTDSHNLLGVSTFLEEGKDGIESKYLIENNGKDEIIKVVDPVVDEETIGKSQVRNERELKYAESIPKIDEKESMHTESDKLFPNDESSCIEQDRVVANDESKHKEADRIVFSDESKYEELDRIVVGDKSRHEEPDSVVSDELTHKEPVCVVIKDELRHEELDCLVAIDESRYEEPDRVVFVDELRHNEPDSIIISDKLKDEEPDHVVVKDELRHEKPDHVVVKDELRHEKPDHVVVVDELRNNEADRIVVSKKLRHEKPDRVVVKDELRYEESDQLIAIDKSRHEEPDRVVFTDELRHDEPNHIVASDELRHEEPDRLVSDKSRHKESDELILVNDEWRHEDPDRLIQEEHRKISSKICEETLNLGNIYTKIDSKRSKHKEIDSKQLDEDSKVLYSNQSKPKRMVDGIELNQAKPESNIDEKKPEKSESDSDSNADEDEDESRRAIPDLKFYEKYQELKNMINEEESKHLGSDPNVDKDQNEEDKFSNEKHELLSLKTGEKHGEIEIKENSETSAHAEVREIEYEEYEILEIKKSEEISGHLELDQKTEEETSMHKKLDINISVEKLDHTESDQINDEEKNESDVNVCKEGEQIDVKNNEKKPEYLEQVLIIDERINEREMKAYKEKSKYQYPKQVIVEKKIELDPTNSEDFRYAKPYHFTSEDQHESEHEEQDEELEHKNSCLKPEEGILNYEESDVEIVEKYQISDKEKNESDVNVNKEDEEIDIKAEEKKSEYLEGEPIIDEVLNEIVMKTYEKESKYQEPELVIVEKELKIDPNNFEEFKHVESDQFVDEGEYELKHEKQDEELEHKKSDLKPEEKKLDYEESDLKAIVKKENYTESDIKTDENEFYYKEPIIKTDEIEIKSEELVPKFINIKSIDTKSDPKIDEKPIIASLMVSEKNEELEISTNEEKTNSLELPSKADKDLQESLMIIIEEHKISELKTYGKHEELESFTKEGTTEHSELDSNVNKDLKAPKINLAKELGGHKILINEEIPDHHKSVKDTNQIYPDPIVEKEKPNFEELEKEVTSVNQGEDKTDNVKKTEIETKILEDQNPGSISKHGSSKADIGKNKKWATFILIGEIASGRSSFIQFILNILEDKDLYENQSIQIMLERRVITEKVTEKGIRIIKYINEPKKIYWKFIETPGVEMYRGGKLDEIKIKISLDLIHSIKTDAFIIFFQKADEKFLCSSIKYIQDDIVRENQQGISMCFVFTFYANQLIFKLDELDFTPCFRLKLDIQQLNQKKLSKQKSSWDQNSSKILKFISFIGDNEKVQESLKKQYNSYKKRENLLVDATAYKDSCLPNMGETTGNRRAETYTSALTQSIESKEKKKLGFFIDGNKKVYNLLKQINPGQAITSVNSKYYSLVKTTLIVCAQIEKISLSEIENRFEYMKNFPSSLSQPTYCKCGESKLWHYSIDQDYLDSQGNNLLMPQQTVDYKISAVQTTVINDPQKSKVFNPFGNCKQETSIETPKRPLFEVTIQAWLVEDNNKVYEILAKKHVNLVTRVDSKHFSLISPLMISCGQIEKSSISEINSKTQLIKKFTISLDTNKISCKCGKLNQEHFVIYEEFLDFQGKSLLEPQQEIIDLPKENKEIDKHEDSENKTRKLEAVINYLEEDNKKDYVWIQKENNLVFNRLKEKYYNMSIQKNNSKYYSLVNKKLIACVKIEKELLNPATNKSELLKYIPGTHLKMKSQCLCEEEIFDHNVAHQDFLSPPENDLLISTTTRIIGLNPPSIENIADSPNSNIIKNSQKDNSWIQNENDRLFKKLTEKYRIEPHNSEFYSLISKSDLIICQQIKPKFICSKREDLLDEFESLIVNDIAYPLYCKICKTLKKDHFLSDKDIVDSQGKNILIMNAKISKITNCKFLKDMKNSERFISENPKMLDDDNSTILNLFTKKFTINRLDSKFVTLVSSNLLECQRIRFGIGTNDYKRNILKRFTCSWGFLNNSCTVCNEIMNNHFVTNQIFQSFEGKSFLEKERI